MASEKYKATLTLYADLMEEIKARMSAIETIANGPRSVPELFVQEFCYLQLRMICELIALGCLVAHGDIKATRKLSGQWSASTIVAELEKLNPRFFPRPFVQKKTAPHRFHFEPVQGGFLTKEELSLLNAECGGRLHRGNLKGLKKKRGAGDFQHISESGNKILALLNCHIMSLFDGKAFVCHMKTMPSGRVSTSIGAPTELAG